jgi:hypothetical protein
MTSVGGRRELSTKMLSWGSSGSLLLRQTTVFIVGNPLTTDAKTERKRTTRQLGAVLTYEPAAITEDVIRHSCLPFYCHDVTDITTVG